MGLSRAREQKIARRLLVVLMLALAAAPFGAATAEAATPAMASQCEDGRPWTSDDVGADGTCALENLCADVSIDLSSDTNFFWDWEFPKRCPVAALDALGITVRRHLLDDDNVPTPIVVEDHSVANPPVGGQGSVPVTCGLITIDFTIVAGNELVASGRGQADTGDCSNPVAIADPPPLLREWAGASSRAGELARLYWTAFGRPPDDDGFNYWAALTTGGLGVRDAMTTWTSLPEWQAIYGQTSNAEFLQRTYQNVFGRPPEDAGNVYWLEQLESGLDRGELVLLFAESAELKQRTLTR